PGCSRKAAWVDHPASMDVACGSLVWGDDSWNSLPWRRGLLFFPRRRVLSRSHARARAYPATFRANPAMFDPACIVGRIDGIFQTVLDMRPVCPPFVLFF